MSDLPYLRAHAEATKRVACLEQQLAEARADLQALNRVFELVRIKREASSWSEAASAIQDELEKAGINTCPPPEATQ